MNGAHDGRTPNPTPPGARPLNILIVDDSAMMRTMIKRVAGLCEVPIAHIFEAANGAEALKVLEANDVDALFTDINMPVMTGTELLREIGTHERYRNLHAGHHHHRRLDGAPRGGPGPQRAALRREAVPPGGDARCPR